MESNEVLLTVIFTAMIVVLGAIAYIWLHNNSPPPVAIPAIENNSYVPPQNNNNNNVNNTIKTNQEFTPPISSSPSGGKTGGSDSGGSNPPSCTTQCTGKVFGEDDSCGGYCPGMTTIPWTTQTINWTQNPKIAVYPTEKWGLYKTGDNISINSTNSTCNSNFKIFDLSGKIVYNKGSGIVTGLQPGHYFVECNGDRTQFAILPAGYNNLSVTGAAGDIGTDSGYTSRTNVINSVWTRDFLLWSDIEPLEGVWNWTYADRFVDINYNASKKIIIGAFYKPIWLNDDNKFMKNYLQLIGNITQRYGNKIYAIEVWNEPYPVGCGTQGSIYNPVSPNLCFNGQSDTLVANYTYMTADAYYYLLNASYHLIKSINPNISVVGPAWSGDFNTYYPQDQRLNELNATQYLDAFTNHDYSDGGMAPDLSGYWMHIANPNVYRIDDQLEKLRNISGFSKMPIIIDEIGLYGASEVGVPSTAELHDGQFISDIDWTTGMSRAIKSALIYRSYNAIAIIPHVFLLASANIEDNLEISGWDFNFRGPHTKTTAFLSSLYWTDNSTFINKTIINKDKTFIYVWQRQNGETIAFAWNIEGQAVSISSIDNAYTSDIYGVNKSFVELGSMPIVFHSNLNGNALMNSIKLALSPTPSAPSNLLANPVSSIQINLNWNVTSITEQGFLIQRSLDNSNWQQIANLSPDTNIYSDSGLIAGTRYNYRVIAYNFAGQSISNTASATTGNRQINSNGLVAFWKFDDSSITAIDSVGHLNGTYAGGSQAVSTSCLIGNCFSGDGTSGRVVELDSNNPIMNLSNNFTFVTWFYPSNATEATCFFSARSNYINTLTNGMRFYVYLNTLDLQGNANNSAHVSFFGSIQNNQWYNLAIVYQNGIIKTYIDGAFIGSDNWGGDLNMSNLNGGSAIGGNGDGDPFKGLIDETRIYNRVLSDSEINQIYTFSESSSGGSSISNIKNVPKLTGAIINSLNKSSHTISSIIIIIIIFLVILFIFILRKKRKR